MRERPSQASIGTAHGRADGAEIMRRTKLSKASIYTALLRLQTASSNKKPGRGSNSKGGMRQAEASCERGMSFRVPSHNYHRLVIRRKEEARLRGEKPGFTTSCCDRTAGGENQWGE
jgi:hypothetical protein